MVVSCDFNYLAPWKNNQATIEVDGTIYEVTHTLFGILGPKYYIARRNGVQVGKPTAKMFPMARQLRRLQNRKTK